MRRNNTVNTIAVIIMLTFSTKFMGFIRDAIIGRRLGVSEEATAYYASFNSTIQIFLSIATGISLTLIPIVVEKVKNKEITNKSINNIINSLLLVTACITVLGLLFAPLFVKLMVSDAKSHYLLTVHLTQIMFPSVIIIVLTYVFVAFLQGNERFVIPAIISIPGNIIVLVYLFFLVDDYGVYGLAIAIVLGWVLQWLVQIPTAMKVGYKYKFYINFKDKVLKSFIVAVIPIIFVTAIHNLNILMDTSIINESKIPIINYSNNIYFPVVTVVVYGITAVMFPKFSKKIVGQDQNEFNSTVTTVIKGLFYLLIPMAIGIIVLSIPIISMVYQEDRFDEAAVLDVARALSAFSIGMIGFGVVDVLNKAFYSRKNIRVPIFTGFCVLCSNFILSILLREQVGYIGIPLASALSFLIGAVILIVLYSKSNQIFVYMTLIKSFLKTLVASLGMGIVVYYLKELLMGITLKSVFLKQGFIIMICGGVGIIVYIIFTLLLKNDISVGLLDKFKIKGRKCNE
ncbi:MAG: murein biosynthesis integral membrane protein MurJ [Eubacteriales bacterium]